MVFLDYSVESPRRWDDFLAALGVAVFAFLALAFWAYPMLHPCVWNEVAFAAGLREPLSPENGLYRLIMRGLFAVLPTARVLDILPVLGRIVVACCAAGVYSVAVEIFPTTLLQIPHLGRVVRRVGRIVAVLAAVLFLGADPVWRAGQTFSPTTLFIAEHVTLWAMFFRFVRRGVLWPLYVCVVILGSMSAEHPIGLLLSALSVLVLLKAVACALNPAVPIVNPLVSSLVRAVTFVRLRNVWFAAFVLQLGADFWVFRALGGLGASGCGTATDYFILYVKMFVGLVTGAASPVGWLFAALVCVAPFVLAVTLLHRAWDGDRFLPYAVGLLFGIVGFVSFAQVSGIRPLWFWLWIRETPMINSDELLSLLLFLDTVAAALALAVFGGDAVLRNHVRIARQNFPESLDEAPSAQLVHTMARDRQIRRRVFLLALTVVPVAVLWGRRQPQVRDMMRVLADYSEEVLAELGTRDVLFTDGSFDTWLELRAAATGRELKTLSLMAPNTPADVRTRLRAAANDEDRALLQSGAVTALRAWLANTSPRLEKAGVQVGFELWQREGADLPPLSGLMALPGSEPSKEEVERSSFACTELRDAVLALDRRYALASCTDRDVHRLFPFVGWRLSRLALLRSKAFDKAGRRTEAFEAAATADELDGVNYALARLYRDSKWLTRQSSGALMPTPREGLVIGLVRADFVLASQFAQPVLRSDPFDPRANFAVGMKHYMDDQFARAEYHLSRCLKRRPNEPAVLNNLAMAQLKLDKLAEAEENARKALALIPTSREVRRTLESVLAARKAKADRQKP